MAQVAEAAEILDAHFDATLGKVEWTLKLLNDQRVSLTWNYEEVGPALGIKAVIPPPMLSMFNERMKRQRIWIMRKS